MYSRLKILRICIKVRQTKTIQMQKRDIDALLMRLREGLIAGAEKHMEAKGV